MPEGVLGSPEGPKSGWRNVDDESMLASHWALWTSTGRDAMSVFQMLSAGNIGHPAAPGTGVPARAGPAPNATVAQKIPATDRTRTPEEASRVPRPARHHVRPLMVRSSTRRGPH